MVSSLGAGPDSHCPLTDGATIIFLPLQPSGTGSGVGFLPAPRAALRDPGKLVGLCRHSFLDQLVSRPAPHAAAGCGHALVPRPSLCLAPWVLAPSAAVCLAIQRLVISPQ